MTEEHSVHLFVLNGVSSTIQLSNQSRKLRVELQAQAREKASSSSRRPVLHSSRVYFCEVGRRDLALGTDERVYRSICVISEVFIVG